MNAVIVVLIFSLVLDFTAVCQAEEDGCSIRCDDVTGTVGTEVNVTCVPQACTECCVKMYKIQQPEKQEFCRQEFTGTCERKNKLTCSLNLTTAIPKQLKFFLQTNCGKGQATFTVAIAERPPRIEDPVLTDTPFKGKIITSAVVGSIIILIIVLMIIHFKKQCCGFVRPKMFKGIRQGEDNPNIIDSTV